MRLYYTYIELYLYFSKFLGATVTQTVENWIIDN